MSVKPTDVPVPGRMHYLPKDRRGYPVPFNVFRDKHGVAHFTINDTAIREMCLRRFLCGICGQKLLRGRWFVGGPLSAFHDAGAYIDTPMHHECATYALRVCPYLALPSYRNRIEAAKLPDDEPAALFIDETMLLHRPPLFVSAMATGQTVLPNGHIRPKRPFRNVEYWRDGAQLSESEARPLIEQELARHVVPALQPPRLVRR